jgi:CRISPR system Cascade subunit CasA
MTLQSRRLRLVRKGGRVTGYLLLGGDFFQKENALAEQMTVWRNAAKKETDPPAFVPKRHDPTRQMWRDYQALYAQGEGKRRPGVVGWVARLKEEGLLPKAPVRFQIAAVKYGDKDFFVEDVFSDSMALSPGLLTASGADWTARIIDEVNESELLVRQLVFLAKNLAQAAGSSTAVDQSQSNAVRAQAYFRLDMPFRTWLEGIDPEAGGDAGSKDEACERWWKQAQRIVRALGKELVDQIGTAAFIGREVIDQKTHDERWLTAPNAFNNFLWKTSARDVLNKPVAAVKGVSPP